ncbi:hypothetical protein IQ229_19345 [Nostoc cf. edaphicum LEGE 07299]|uniref:Uncharacterized protein n=1 Tax=Nostoc cf. edaphicum LEGE 07299 TaxID=2777974 RepID=A0ABR9U2X9_9NOSO|nr:hypothetical protein [Nostoc cf. edaphicum LEGE 07299]
MPLKSAMEQFNYYPRANIQLKPFIQGNEQIQGNTDESVNHSPLMHNTDVQKLILKTLNVNLDEDSISTGLATNISFDLVEAIGKILFDPVEGFLVDGQGRRLGYTQATGPVTEIPNSFWLGDTEGIGWIAGQVEGPVTLQLTGTGEEYLVSVAVETSTGPAAIEVQGFLAQGEQQTFNIPVNNFPILDLNTSTEGIDSSTSLTIPQQNVAITNSFLEIADSESANLQGATVTIKNPQNGISEFLGATATGNITVAYALATSTLTLSGADTIANYQQVLRTVTYSNTAANPNLTPREIEFVVNDGASFNNLSPVATTILTLLTFDSNLNLTGTSGNDTLVGGSGNDTLSGLGGNDYLDGKAGNDYLDGGTGNDYLDGGTGNDTYIVGSSADVVSETSTTVTEIDTVSASVSYTLGVNVENLSLTGTSAINGTGNSLNNSVTGNSGSNVLDGGAGNDNLNAGAGNDSLNGGAGNDSLSGGTGNDTYIVDSLGDSIIENANEGTDAVQSSVDWTLGDNLEYLTLTGTDAINGTGNALNNRISGNTVNNTLIGGDGNDSLNGQAGNDNLDAGAGNDSLNGGAGNDSLSGGAGNDYFEPGTGIDNVVGGLGNDDLSLNLSSATGNIVVNYTNSNAGTVSNGTTFSEIESINLTTGSGNDIINLGAAVDSNVRSGSGQDTITTGAGNDYLYGEAGNDTLNGGAGNDYLYGGINDDYLDGNAGNDNLYGEAGNDTLNGGDGNDILNSGTGDDVLNGGLNNDTYFVDSASDSIFEDTNAGIDSVNTSITWTLGNNLENLTLTGTTAIDGTGNILNNTIAGNSGANNLFGNEGNDSLSGNSGNDLLDGGTGDDTMLGGSGNDVLIGNFGNDVLTLSTGADIFVLNSPNQGVDRITDFLTVDDTLHVSAAGFGGGLTAGASIVADQILIGSGTVAATSASQRFIYNTSTGALFFDADGNQTGSSAVQIATLSNKPLMEVIFSSSNLKALGRKSFTLIKCHGQAVIFL